ncbi:hypothetical protein SISNIDRAFT_460956 [Sistotremastrum niveocremeum HHB9708]|uniref:MYND-type domain-containing protein n=2 Tax=Sistotremastraceae TaxID=3402574 RepID=A0A164N4L1_9AGAM|nr:hypothetical protein SISNIDRAFT_460956 [Sistotremastrum niveocremeum HHB9708]KZT39889.1 hypothetical protein SISSUDRAFT_1045030 [Sistotremastrum suecicum HHB10207 ss-3]
MSGIQKLQDNLSHLTVKSCTRPKGYELLNSKSFVADYVGLDPRSRNTYKKMHERFSQIMTTLEKLYTDHIGVSSIVILCVIDLVRDMAADVVLMNKIYKLKHVWLLRMVDLLEHELLRFAALDALSRFLMHPSPEICEDLLVNHIDKITSVLFVPDLDPQLARHTLHIMGTIIRSTLGSRDTDTVKSAISKKNVNVKGILKVLMNHLQNSPGTDPEIATTTCNQMLLSGSLSFVYPDITSRTSIVLQCYTACLRSASLKVRCQGMQTIYDNGTDTRKGDPPQPFGHYQIIRAWTAGFSADIQADLAVYGGNRCQGPMSMKAVQILYISVATLKKGDFYNFGLTLIKCHPGVEHLIFMLPCPWKSAAHPFNTWLEAIPHTVNVMRSKSDLDNADILEIRYLLKTMKTAEAHELARKAARRSPTIGFWYFAQVFGSDGEHLELLEIGQKGLKCPILTSEERYGLLYGNSLRGWQLAMSAIASDKANYEKGVAYLTRCHEDLQLIMDISPPDNPGMIELVDLLILVTILIRGPELRTDLNSELGPLLKKRSLISRMHDQIALMEPTAVSGPFSSTIAKDVLFKHLATAAIEWKDFIARCDTCAWAEEERALKTGGPPPQYTYDRIEGRHLDVLRAASERTVETFIASDFEVRLYNCFWCQSPSAVLRKCSICQQACYCDSKCQKLHWKEHKKVCKSPQLSK